MFNHAKSHQTSQKELSSSNSINDLLLLALHVTMHQCANTFVAPNSSVGLDPFAFTPVSIPQFTYLYTIIES